MIHLPISEGGPYERGHSLGLKASKAIHVNMTEFWRLAASHGFGRATTINRLEGKISELFDLDDIEYMRGVSMGAKVTLSDLLALNTLKGVLSPDECTVLIAMKDSTASKSTIMLKNSDKIGSEKFVGKNFHQHKEINTVLFEKPDNGNKYIAVAAAGELAIKMGMNDKGVATGANISRTTELKEKRVDVTQMRALDRGWLMKEGILKGSTAKQAAQLVLEKLQESPMSTPGNLEFVDDSEAFIIEGSYDRSAVQKFISGVIARSNRFVLLHDLNDPEDISSYARYVRGMQLLTENKGKITPEKMVGFSQDHANGPGPNSICRHNPDFRSETSLSAAVMEINSTKPSASRFHVALGKPCHAWASTDAHAMISLDERIEDVPFDFKDGETWKIFYTEDPRTLPAAPVM